jgi:hypothetical protein
MDSVDLLRCVWLVLVTGAAYAAVIIRRVILGQKHPLDWPVDLEVSAAVGSAAVAGNTAGLHLVHMLLGSSSLLSSCKSYMRIA